MAPESTRHAKRQHTSLWQNPRTYVVIIVSSWLIAAFLSLTSMLVGSGWVAVALVWAATAWITYRLSLFVRYYKSKDLLRLGELDRAATVLENLKDSRFIGNYFKWCCCINLAVIRLVQCDFSSAAELAGRSRKFCRKRPIQKRNSLVTLYSALVRLKRGEEAEALAGEIGRLPAHPQLDFIFKCNRAYGLISEGRHEDALAEIETYARNPALIPGIETCLFNAEMAHLLTHVGRKTEARPYLDRLENMPKGKPAIYARQNPALAHVFDSLQGARGEDAPASRAEIQRGYNSGATRGNTEKS